MQKQKQGRHDGFAPVKSSWTLDADCPRCRNAHPADTETSARPAANQGVGMVGAVMQTLDTTYASAEALRAGTLFPALNMPLNGYGAPAAGCGDAAQEGAFAAWELRLFLNTHPNDRDALKLFRRLRQQAGENSYATAFLPGETCSDRWDWVDAPWPWEYVPQGD